MNNNEIAKEVYGFQPNETVKLTTDCLIPDPLLDTSDELLRAGTLLEFIRFIDEDYNQDYSELFYPVGGNVRVKIPTEILTRPR